VASANIKADRAGPPIILARLPCHPYYLLVAVTRLFFAEMGFYKKYAQRILLLLHIYGIKYLINQTSCECYF
jgi:hypothetical protein